MSKKKQVMSHDPLADLDRPAPGGQAQSTAPGALADGAGSAVDAASNDPFVLPASLRVADVGEFRSELSACLNDRPALTLDGAAVELIEGAGVQLLAALFRTAAQRQVAVRWSAASATLHGAARQMGLDRVLLLTDLQDA